MSSPTNAPTLGFLMHDVARLMRRRFEQHARCLSLTRSQYQALAFLAPNEGIHQGGLADILEIEPITLGRILDKLEERGLVERRQHPRDRRIWQLYLMPAAHPLLVQMRELGDVTRGEALAGLDEQARAALLQSLCTMKTNLAGACQTPAADRVEEIARG